MISPIYHLFLNPSYQLLCTSNSAAGRRSRSSKRQVPRAKFYPVVEKKWKNMDSIEYGYTWFKNMVSFTYDRYTVWIYNRYQSIFIADDSCTVTTKTPLIFVTLCAPAAGWRLPRLQCLTSSPAALCQTASILDLTPGLSRSWGIAMTSTCRRGVGIGKTATSHWPGI